METIRQRVILFLLGMLGVNLFLLGMLGVNTRGLYVTNKAPISYVTSEGLLRLPDRIRRQLKIEHGGGVTFLERKDTGHIELLTDAQFLNLFETHGTEYSPICDTSDTY